MVSAFICDQNLVGVLDCVAFVLMGAPATEVAGDGDVAQSGDCGLGEHLDVDAAPVALVIPAVS
ncbi:MAG TPA: hypothetical protein VJ625_10830 [Propionibacteriaceae bacterium]|nr:hypothetical protein [Propionibacteriaceae bacterium]